MCAFAHTDKTSMTTWRMGGIRKCPPCTHPYHRVLKHIRSHPLLSTPPTTLSAHAELFVLHCILPLSFRLRLESPLPETVSSEIHGLPCLPSWICFFRDTWSPLSLCKVLRRLSLFSYEEEFQYIFAGVSWVRVSENGTAGWALVISLNCVLSQLSGLLAEVRNSRLGGCSFCHYTIWLFLFSFFLPVLLLSISAPFPLKNVYPTH